MLSAFRLIRLHSDDCSHQHGLGFVGRTVGLLGDRPGRERKHRCRRGGDREFTDHGVPPLASSDERTVHANIKPTAYFDPNPTS
jgi:hypothetical protein